MIITLTRRVLYQIHPISRCSIHTLRRSIMSHPYQLSQMTHMENKLERLSDCTKVSLLYSNASR